MFEQETLQSEWLGFWIFFVNGENQFLRITMVLVEDGVDLFQHLAHDFLLWTRLKSEPTQAVDITSYSR